MTALLGTFALAVAFCSALATTGVWAAAAVYPDRWEAPRWVCFLPLLGTGAAVGIVEVALVTHDFSVRFVAENGNRATPVYYTVTSLWSAHDGSLLLWVLILGGYLAAVAMLGRAGPRGLHRWAVAALASVTSFFAGLALFTSHLFDRVSPTPPDGPGPNPLLADHPAMGVHPPLLYTGLLGTAVLFGYAVGALVTGDAGARWGRAVRPWALWTWSTLTGGIVMGAWWSYSVLGWGGYWAWDPVENAALLPWLLLTALLHAGMVQRRGGALPLWNLALALGAFVLACLGVFLTRSGVSASVHAFASSGIGVALLAFLAAVLAAVAGLALQRRGAFGPPGDTALVAAGALSRAWAIMVNNVLLTMIAVTVLVGTLFPVLANAVRGTQVSVGASYFDTISVPLVACLLALMGVGPYLRWRGEGPSAVLRRALGPALVGVLVLLWLALRAPTGRYAMVTLALAAYVAAGVVLDAVTRIRTRGLRTALPGLAAMVSHLGVAVLLVGVAGSSAYGVAGETTVSSSRARSVSGVTVTVDRVNRSHQYGDSVTRADLRLQQNGHVIRLSPGLRYSPTRDMTVAVPAVSSRLTGDLYVTLLSADQGGQVTVRVARNPMVGWVWAGGALMAVGGVASLLLSRSRRRARRARRHGRAESPVSAGDRVSAGAGSP